MIALLLSGDGTVAAQITTRAQLPLLLAQATNVTSATLGQATEADTALPMTVLLSGAAIVQVGQVTEEDTALAVSVAVASDQFLSVGQVTETDEAFPITFVASGDVFVEIGIAEETDEAFPISFTRTFIRPHDDRDLSITSHVDADLTLTPVEVE